MGLFAVVLAGIIGLASSATEIVIPLLPLAAVPYVIGAGLGAAGLATLKTSAVAGAYLYLRKRGAIGKSSRNLAKNPNFFPNFLKSSSVREIWTDGDCGK